jgi:hypothetical protein
VFGAAATILWMSLLRFQPGYFWVTPLTPWALILATAGATIFLEKHLAEAIDAGEESARLPGTTPESVATLDEGSAPARIK